MDKLLLLLIPLLATSKALSFNVLKLCSAVMLDITLNKILCSGLVLINAIFYKHKCFMSFINSGSLLIFDKPLIFNISNIYAPPMYILIVEML